MVSSQNIAPTRIPDRLGLGDTLGPRGRLRSRSRLGQDVDIPGEEYQQQMVLFQAR